MDRPGTIYTVILIGTAFWCGALLMAPICAASSGGLNGIAPLLYRFFDPICHQIPQRSFFLHGEPLAVCSRCASIYFAFLCGVIIYPHIGSINRPQIPSRIVLMTSLIPMLIEVAASLLGIHESSLLSKALTGGVFGLVIPFYVIPAAIEAFSRQHHTSGLLHTSKGSSDA